jgi:hypothetical protein
MSGRAILKRVMRNRGHGLKGWRYVNVRLPLTIFPEPPPDMTLARDWGEEAATGFWKKDLGDGRVRRTVITPSYGDVAPADAVLVKHKGEGLKWWEGLTWVEVNGVVVGDKTHLPIEEVRAVYARHVWETCWIDGHTTTGVEFPQILLDLYEAAYWGEGMYYDIKGDWVYLRLFVKSYMRNHRDKFVKCLTSALREACKSNTPIRIR